MVEADRKRYDHVESESGKAEEGFSEIFGRIHSAWAVD